MSQADIDENIQMIDELLAEEAERQPARTTCDGWQWQGDQEPLTGPPQGGLSQGGGDGQLADNRSDEGHHAADGRPPHNGWGQDPYHNPDYCQPDYIRQFRMEIPHLDHLDDELILATRITDLLKMESNSIKRQTVDRSKSQEDKLLKNLDDARNSHIVVPAGTDDRNRDLHMARFMPAPFATGQEQWLAARKHWGINGHPAVGAFDMNCVGLDGHVTARGWIELQNPSSTGLSAKQFTLSNNTSRIAADKRITLGSEDDTFEVRESLKEAASVMAFQTSMRVMREAARLCMPWNSSIAALESYLINNEWLSKDIGTGQAAVRILSEFTDHIFAVNAGRWRTWRAFLDPTELGSVWTSWYTSRGGAIGPHHRPSTSHGGSGGGGANSGQGQPARKKNGQPQMAQPKRPAPAKAKPARAAIEDNICKRYNVNKCPNQATGICRTAAGMVLKHVCNYIKNDGSRCEAAHIRLNH
jgi:hypothetical protein